MQEELTPAIQYELLRAGVRIHEPYDLVRTEVEIVRSISVSRGLSTEEQEIWRKTLEQFGIDFHYSFSRITLKGRRQL